MAVVLVRGTGDVGSAVAAIVHRAGHQVVLHDRAAPAHTRRGMALVDALYEGTAELEGQIAKRARTLQLDLEGEPQAIAGHSRERYVYAPLAGVFTTQLHIGDAVMEGQEIARIGNTPIQAPLTGCLRGLTHDGATVSVRTKIVEVDPRGDPQKIYGLGLRPKRIAEGVFEAINEWAATTFVSRTPATPSAKGP